jgi:hypothetical protein
MVNHFGTGGKLKSGFGQQTGKKKLPQAKA